MLKSHRRRPGLTLVALLTGVVVSVGLVFAPVYSNGETLAQVNGRGILMWLVLPPILLVGVHLGSDLVAFPSLALLGVFVFISGFSIGFFYSPSLVLAVLGVLLVKRDAHG